MTNRQHCSSVALICVKMASVMGITWILGIAANLKALSFLWYLYVVLNSLQGTFNFLLELKLLYSRDFNKLFCFTISEKFIILGIQQLPYFALKE